jgi:hypothetical protein
MPPGSRTALFCARAACGGCPNDAGPYGVLRADVLFLKKTQNFLLFLPFSLDSVLFFC